MPGSLRNLKENELHHLSTLATLSKMLNTSYRVQDILDSVMTVVVQALGAQRGIIVLDRQPEPQVAAMSGLAGEEFAKDDFRYSRTVVERVLREGQPVLSHNALQDRRFLASQSLRVLHARSILCVPMRCRGKVIGCIYLDNLWSAGVFGTGDRQLLEILADLAATALERAEYFRQTLEMEQMRREEESRRRLLYREVLAAVTGGRLHLLEPPEFEAEAGSVPGDVLPLETVDQVSEARIAAEETLADAGWEQARLFDMATAVSEAATNVLVHGGGGWMRLHVGPDSLRALFVDQGPGIDFEHLPRATLMAGYSTRPSLGLGFTVLLDLMDRVCLCTGPTGTRLLLEASRSPRDREAEFLECVPTRFHWE